MIRTLAILVLLTAIPAHAQDNNPFSGATGIRVEMVREEPASFSQNERRHRFQHRYRKLGFSNAKFFGGHPIRTARRQASGRAVKVGDNLRAGFVDRLE